MISSKAHLPVICLTYLLCESMSQDNLLGILTDDLLAHLKHFSNVNVEVRVYWKLVFSSLLNLRIEIDRKCLEETKKNRLLKLSPHQWQKVSLGMS